MIYINKTIVMGNLTRDPEFKALPSGQNVCNFSLATNERYTNKDGNKEEKTEFHNIVVYGKQAENCAKYLLKGQLAVVEGKLATRSWEKEGQKHYSTEIIATKVQFGPKSRAQANSEASSASVVPGSPAEEINPDDIFF